MKSITILLLLTSLVSCATYNSLGPLPNDDEKHKSSKIDLIRKYPDISNYENTWRGFSPNFPNETSLLASLGEPESKENDWSWHAVAIVTLAALGAEPLVWGLVAAIRPLPPKEYTYNNGNYCIKAKIDNTILSGYDNYMLNWKWQEKTTECK